MPNSAEWLVSSSLRYTYPLSLCPIYHQLLVSEVDSVDSHISNSLIYHPSFNQDLGSLEQIRISWLRRSWCSRSITKRTTQMRWKVRTQQSPLLFPTWTQLDPVDYDHSYCRRPQVPCQPLRVKFRDNWQRWCRRRVSCACTPLSWSWWSQVLRPEPRRWWWGRGWRYACWASTRVSLRLWIQGLIFGHSDILRLSRDEVRLLRRICRGFPIREMALFCCFWLK